MKRTEVWLVLFFLMGFLFPPGSITGMTIQFGSGGTEFIVKGDEWKFFRGTVAPSEPAGAWKEPEFIDSEWETGPSGFGYEDDDDATILGDMRYNYVSVYIRKTFTITSVPVDEVLELVIDYDDGFVAYLNGNEVARRGFEDGEPVTFEMTANNHEAGTPETIPLGKAGDLLAEGSNLLAIEGHNTAEDSSDFSLIPALRTASDTVKNGDTWIAETETAALRGSTDSPEAVSVKVNGDDAEFNAGTGIWQDEVTLVSGLNTITVEALDSGANIVDTGSIEILYVPPSNRFSGELAENTTWSGAALLDDSVDVPAGTVLTIEPGTVILLKDAVTLNIFGQLLAAGTEQKPIRFTHYGDGTTWKQIRFVEAADSRLEHCFVEYADSEGAHQDYYEPGPRDYHEAILVLASHIDLLQCTFQNLPDDRSNAEGDAIAIISDDQDHPGEATAHVRGCRFLSIGQGVHTRYSYVLVEDCFFEGHRGDNDDVDLWGESDPPALIRNNLFLKPNQDDPINPTRSSAHIIGNIILGSPDHGIVLRDRCFPVVKNNIVYNCDNGGIAVENSCEALLVNNTIVGCGRGLRLFDLGRWDPPYRLNPGGGTVTLINSIVWDCDEPVPWRIATIRKSRTAAPT